MGDGTACDPGREQVVGVFGEVVAHECVEQVGVATQVCVGEHDQLPLADGAGEGVGPVEVGAVPGQQGGGDEDRRRVGRRRPGQHLVGGAGVAADEAVEEGGLVIGHRTTVA